MAVYACKQQQPVPRSPQKSICASLDVLGEPCVQGWSVMRCRAGGYLHTQASSYELLQSQDRWVQTSPWTFSISTHGFVLLSLFLHRKTQFLSQPSLCRWELSAVISKTSLTDLLVSKSSALCGADAVETAGSSTEMATQEDWRVLQNARQFQGRLQWPPGQNLMLSASAKACSRPCEAYEWDDASTNLKKILNCARTRLRMFPSTTSYLYLNR